MDVDTDVRRTPSLTTMSDHNTARWGAIRAEEIRPTPRHSPTVGAYLYKRGFASPIAGSARRRWSDETSVCSRDTRLHPGRPATRALDVSTTKSPGRGRPRSPIASRYPRQTSILSERSPARRYEPTATAAAVKEFALCPARLSVARRTPGQTPLYSRRVSDGERTRVVGAARHPPVTPTIMDFVEAVSRHTCSRRYREFN
jgi:hypothetical protein